MVEVMEALILTYTQDELRHGDPQRGGGKRMLFGMPKTRYKKQGCCCTLLHTVRVEFNPILINERIISRTRAFQQTQLPEIVYVHDDRCVLWHALCVVRKWLCVHLLDPYLTDQRLLP